MYEALSTQSDGSSVFYCSDEDLPFDRISLLSSTLENLPMQAKTTFDNDANIDVQCKEHKLYSICYTSDSTLPSPVRTIGKENKLNAHETDSNADSMTSVTPSRPIGPCPLPALSWADEVEVWQELHKKDEKYAHVRSSIMFKKHPDMKPHYRTITLNWLMELCVTNKQRRETYYLAVDYMDRYMHAVQWMPKSFFQLVGVTCLFVASKVEEIHALEIKELASLSDGVCNEIDIRRQELILLKILDWDTNAITPISWLGIFLQLNVNKYTSDSLVVSDTNTGNNNISKTEAIQTNNQIDITVKENANEYNELIHTKSIEDDRCVDRFLYPQFSSCVFAQTAQLLDLCSYDENMADYSYAVLAASAMYHTFNAKIAVRLSGLPWASLKNCVLWMRPFFEIIREESLKKKGTENQESVCSNTIIDDSYTMQTHVTTIEMFVRACELREKYMLNKKRTQSTCNEGHDGDDDESDQIDVGNHLTYKRKAEVDLTTLKCKKNKSLNLSCNCSD
ncbi:G1/S-specific cyclin-E-like [Teleopsis dalmanni]|uniref:G1/S-specific cyclin-E-like n=1 Tax=Teleopsis dalmanni TaxID=139649 RepID=UPI0018CD05DB|nr:G1/S-specific cyclin-E-like [Teleopsis dalmanni]